MRLEWDTVQGFVGDIHSILVSTASWSRNNTVCVISRALMAALKGIKARSATAHQERYPNSVALYAGGVVTGKKKESRVPGWMCSTAASTTNPQTQRAQRPVSDNRRHLRPAGVFTVSPVRAGVRVRSWPCKAEDAQEERNTIATVMQ
jgi:hypothetical protein